MLVVAVESQSTGCVAARLGLANQDVACLGIDKRSIIFCLRLFSNDKDLHALVVGIEVAQMGSIAMTKACTPEQSAVVVESSRTDHHLVEAIAIEVTNGQAMSALCIDALSLLVRGVLPQHFQFGAIPAVGSGIAIGVDTAHSDGTGCRLSVNIEEGYAAFEPVAAMPVGSTVSLTRTVIPIAAYAEQRPVVGGGQFVARHAVETRQTFLTATGDDTRCVD